MNIALASDNNYSKYLLVTVLSIIKSNENSDITFYIIDSGIDDVNKKLINSVVIEYKKEIKYYDANELTGTLNVDNSFSLASYSRLFLTNIPELDRIIYLDCDVCSFGNLEELWQTDLGDSIIAGVFDPVMPYYKTLIGLKENDLYVNAGVLLMDLHKMRAINWNEKVVGMIKDYSGSVPHHDQGIINHILNGKIKLINPKFNLMDVYYMYSKEKMEKLTNSVVPYDEKVISEALALPAVVHYTAGFYGRPWDMKCTHPLQKTYLDVVSDLGIEINSFLTDMPENKNSVRMRFLYQTLPFSLYCFLNKLLSKLKEKTWKKKLSMKKQS